MRKIFILAAAMAWVPMAAGAQPATDPTRTDTSRLDQLGNSNSGASDNKNSTSSRNTPTAGEPTGRNNPSVSRKSDDAPSRGTQR